MALPQKSYLKDSFPHWLLSAASGFHSKHNRSPADEEPPYRIIEAAGLRNICWSCRVVWAPFWSITFRGSIPLQYVTVLVNITLTKTVNITSGFNARHLQN